MLTYEALAAGVDADRVLDDVLERVPMPRIELAQERATRPDARELPGAAAARPARRSCPLAVAAYVLAQRRRRRFAVRYTNVDLLAAVGRPLVGAPPAGAVRRCSRWPRC